MTKPINFIIYGDAGSGTSTILKNIHNKLTELDTIKNLKIKIDDDYYLSKNWSQITEKKPLAPIVIKDYAETWSKPMLSAIHGDGVIIRPRGKRIDASTLRFSAIVTYQRGLQKFVNYTQSVFPEFQESDIDFVFAIEDYYTLHVFNPEHNVEIRVPWDPAKNIKIANQTVLGILDVILAEHLN